MHAWRQFAKRTYHWPEGAFIDFIISSISFIKARLKGAGARYIQFLFSLISSLSTIAVGTAGETSIGSFSSQQWHSLRCPWMSCASTWHSKWATLFLELWDWHKMGSNQFKSSFRHRNPHRFGGIFICEKTSSAPNKLFWLGHSLRNFPERTFLSELIYWASLTSCQINKPCSSIAKLVARNKMMARQPHDLCECWVHDCIM